MNTPVIDGMTVAEMAAIINTQGEQGDDNEARIAALEDNPGTGGVSSVAGKTGVVTLVKGDVGLGNVNNTADPDKPISTAQAAVNAAKANLDSNGVVALTNRKVLGTAPYLINTGTAEDPILSINFNDATFVAAIQAIAGGTPSPTPGVTPSGLIVNDTAKTLAWTINSGETVADFDFTQDAATTIVTATANPMTVSVLPNAINRVGVRRKAKGSNTASAWAYNQTAYTASAGGGAVALIAGSKDASVVVNSATNTYTTADTADWNHRIWNTGKKLTGDGGVFQDSTTAASSVFGLGLTDAATYYGNIRAAIWDTGTEIFAVDSVNGNAYVEGKSPGYVYGVVRTGASIEIRKSNDNFSTSLPTSPPYVFSGSIAGTLYPLGDVRNNNSSLVNPKGVGLVSI